eukprot:3934954-Rhodomonas_salina.2
MCERAEVCVWTWGWGCGWGGMQVSRVDAEKLVAAIDQDSDGTITVTHTPEPPNTPTHTLANTHTHTHTHLCCQCLCLGMVEGALRFPREQAGSGRSGRGSSTLGPAACLGGGVPGMLPQASRQPLRLPAHPHSSPPWPCHFYPHRFLPLASESGPEVLVLGPSS